MYCSTIYCLDFVFVYFLLRFIADARYCYKNIYLQVHIYPFSKTSTFMIAYNTYAYMPFSFKTNLPNYYANVCPNNIPETVYTLSNGFVSDPSNIM